MSLIGSGKGNSATQTQQTVNDTKVSTESGIAVGGGATANINVSSSDPETVKAALAANYATSHDALASNLGATSAALSFAGHSAEIAAQTSQLAQGTVERIAGTSILASSDLAKKFADNTTQQLSQNIGLLSSLSQQSSDQNLAAQQTANRALDSAFSVARAAAPQDPNYSATETVSTISRYGFYAVAAVALAVLGFFFLRRKSA